MSSFTLLERARDVVALVLDVDGILSNGQLIFSNNGEELKAFDVRDGLGMKLVQQAGVKIVVITGRSSQIVATRMQSLGVDLVLQGREDKGIALLEACHTLNISPSQCLYMGDDWPDLSALVQVGFAVTVPNGHVELKRRAHYITAAQGGCGAVREVCDLMLQAKGVYDDLLATFLTIS